jgi:hypothetical protein
MKKIMILIPVISGALLLCILIFIMIKPIFIFDNIMINKEENNIESDEYILNAWRGFPIIKDAVEINKGYDCLHYSSSATIRHIMAFYDSYLQKEGFVLEETEPFYVIDERTFHYGNPWSEVLIGASKKQNELTMVLVCYQVV